MSEITKEIQLTENDYTKFSSIACQKTNAKLILLSITTVIITLLIMYYSTQIIGSLIAQTSFKFQPKIKSGLILIAYIASAYIIATIISKYLKKHIKIDYLAAKGEFLRHKTTSINEKGITQESAESHAFTSWNGVIKIESHKDMILFYIDNLQAYIIPKRTFETTEEADAFLQQAETFWQDAKKSDSKEKKRPWNAHVEVSHPEETLPI